MELLLDHVDIVGKVLVDHRLQRAVDQFLLVLGEQMLQKKSSNQPIGNMLTYTIRQLMFINLESQKSTEFN